MSKPPYVRAAFWMPANLLGLASAAIASVLVGDPTPLLVGLGAEGLYLGLLSNSRLFRRAIRAASGARERDEEQLHTAAGLLEDLAPSQREQYQALRGLRDLILANYRKLPGGRVLAAASEQRVDALLTSFLRLLGTLDSYRKYLSATDRKAVEAELAQLRAEVANEANPRLKEVKERRVEILQKRAQRFQQAEESRAVVSHQLASIEDLLKLTHEQSIAIRDPDIIGRHLEALTAEVKESDEAVRDLERFMEFEETAAPPIPHGQRVR